jgi:hypothetical protein
LGGDEDEGTSGSKRMEILRSRVIILCSVLIACYASAVRGEGLECYTIHWAPMHVWGLLRSKGINTIVTALSPSDRGGWAIAFERARQLDLKLIVALWPLPYKMNGDEVSIQGAEEFLNYLKLNPEDRQRVLALYGVDEPFWQDCYGCGWTTPQMIRLRERIRRIIPDMKMYYDMGDISFWERMNRDPSSKHFFNKTWIDDTAFDYLSIYYGKDHSGKRLQESIRANRSVLNGDNTLGRKLNINLICMMNTYRSTAFKVAMPNRDELVDFSGQAISSGQIDGYGFYPWHMDLYEDDLSRHPEVWDAIEVIYRRWICRAPDCRYGSNRHE